MSYRAIFGVASLVLAVAGYIPYIRDMLAGTTKPHALSWLVWSVLSTIAFAIQLTNNGGSGAWLTAFTAVATFGIFLVALKTGEVAILTVDWLSLTIAALALLLWFTTDQPLPAVILISIVDGVGGFFPTFRKSMANPNGETASLYFVYAISLSCSLVALANFSLVNALYPASFVLINASMALFLLVRRRQLSK